MASSRERSSAFRNPEEGGQGHGRPVRPQRRRAELVERGDVEGRAVLGAAAGRRGVAVGALEHGLVVDQQLDLLDAEAIASERRHRQRRDVGQHRDAAGHQVIGTVAAGKEVVPRRVDLRPVAGGQGIVETGLRLEPHDHGPVPAEVLSRLRGGHSEGRPLWVLRVATRRGSRDRRADRTAPVPAVSYDSSRLVASPLAGRASLRHRLVGRRTERSRIPRMLQPYVTLCITLR